MSTLIRELQISQFLDSFLPDTQTLEWQETIYDDSEYTTDSKSHTQPVLHFIHKFSDPHIYLKLLPKDTLSC